MATYRNRGGRSMKSERLYIANAFEQKGKTKNGMEMNGYNLQVGVANDLTEDKTQVITDPMLRYDTYTKADGEKGKNMTVAVSKNQYDAIMAVANTDGDKPVFHADLFPKGSGLMLDTKTVKPAEVPFNIEKHREVTAEARAMRAAERAAKAAEEGAPAPEAEAQAEQPAVQAEGPEMG